MIDNTVHIFSDIYGKPTGSSLKHQKIVENNVDYNFELPFDDLLVVEPQVSRLKLKDIQVCLLNNHIDRSLESDSFSYFDTATKKEITKTLPGPNVASIGDLCSQINKLSLNKINIGVNTENLHVEISSASSNSITFGKGLQNILGFQNRTIPLNSAPTKAEHLPRISGYVEMLYFFSKDVTKSYINGVMSQFAGRASISKYMYGEFIDLPIQSEGALLNREKLLSKKH